MIRVSPRWTVFAAGGLACGAARAQTVEGIEVTKARFSRQTSATRVDLLPAVELPYGFGAEVWGADLGGIAAPSVAGPIANPEPGHNGGVLGYVPEELTWRYGWPSFDDWRTQTQGELDALFGSGVYTFDVMGSSVPLSLTGDAYVSTTPTLTITGGAWVGGAYVIDENAALTITTSAFAEYGTHFEDVIFIGVFNDTSETVLDQLASADPAQTATLTIPGGTLQLGAYEIESGFVALVDGTFTVPEFPDAIAAADYEVATRAALRVSCSPADVTSVNAPVGDPNHGVPDGSVSAADIQFYVNAWVVGDPAADWTTQNAPAGDPDYGVPDGAVTASDIQFYVNLWVAGCP